MSTTLTLSNRVSRKLERIDAVVTSRFSDAVSALMDDSVRAATSLPLKSPLTDEGLIYSIRVDDRYRLLYKVEGDIITVIDIVTPEDFRRLRGARS
jgi:mRNA-degrading endonuclease RelE of RelBE toxin-antitoxin system